MDDGDEVADDLDEVAATRVAARRHREVLVVAAIALALAFALDVGDDDRVTPRGCPGIPLPPTCMSRSLFGVDCPGCGLTRSVIRASRGDWSGSWRTHHLGILFLVVLLIQVPYRLAALRRPARPIVPPRWQDAMSYALIALLIGNWLIGLAARGPGPGLP
ncbi:hypothetical protein OJF2_27330 [Aquisphaera giovannonii]|uniref:DUF2752 domain-containing protein n=1 Tax=Aquisphaera giovannonii TaxID=406548 RepID=A0A5B9W115_9BACT|nr:DUF2752 domain-containing protein [Aquisphaera giovannonii]QEH34198.1 hypothetical protein OJF2_27330 [Aquisphaera giovannonii]